MAKEPAKSAARSRRLAKALKANLARRKAQTRARKATPGAKAENGPTKAD